MVLVCLHLWGLLRCLNRCAGDMAVGKKHFIRWLGKKKSYDLFLGLVVTLVGYDKGLDINIIVRVRLYSPNDPNLIFHQSWPPEGHRISTGQHHHLHFCYQVWHNQMLNRLYNCMSSQNACRLELKVPMQMKCVFLPLAMLM